MCNAIPLAMLLVTAFAGLTVLRWLRSPTPNADLLIVLLSMLEGSDDIPPDTGKFPGPRTTGQT